MARVPSLALLVWLQLMECCGLQKAACAGTVSMGWDGRLLWCQQPWPRFGERLLERHTSLQEGSPGQSRGGEMVEKGKGPPAKLWEKGRMLLGISRGLSQPRETLSRWVEHTQERTALVLTGCGTYLDMFYF